MTQLECAYFPSWRLGYRCNPFRALTREEWQDLALLPTALRNQLNDWPPIVQVIGDQGRGKTSILLAIKRHLLLQDINVAYEYLPPGKKRNREKLRNIQVYLLDEAQRLGSRRWRQLIRQVTHPETYPSQIIFSSHVDLLEMNVTTNQGIHTIHLDTPSRGFVKAMIKRRLEYFELQGRRGVQLSSEANDLLLAHCSSDLRLLERILYEIYQTWGQETTIRRAYVEKMILEQS